MVKKPLSFILFFSLLLIISSFETSSVLTCKEIVEKMIKKISEVERLKYSLKIVERTNGKFNNFGSSVKLNRKPRKLYLTTNGIEVLWTEGTNKGKALVNPNSFPFINLNLDPMGSLMRSDQHHTINEMGFDYFGNIIAYNARQAGASFEKYFKYEGDEVLNGRSCHKITINNPDFKFISYTVKKGENLVKIARNYRVAEFMILENNPKLDDYDDVKEGDIIKIPNMYAKNVLIYVDKANYLPIGVRVYDHKGLFEQYDYFSLQVNPHFEDAEFTRNYKDYKF